MSNIDLRTVASSRCARPSTTSPTHRPDKPASRYQEAHATTCRPTPTSTTARPGTRSTRSSTPRRTADRDGGLVRAQGPAPVLLRHLHASPAPACRRRPRPTSSSSRRAAWPTPARRRPSARRSTCCCRCATSPGARNMNNCVHLRLRLRHGHHRSRASSRRWTSWASPSTSPASACCCGEPGERSTTASRPGCDDPAWQALRRYVEDTLVREGLVRAVRRAEPGARRPALPAGLRQLRSTTLVAAGRPGGRDADRAS